jgi:hypothetical protein
VISALQLKMKKELSSEMSFVSTRLHGVISQKTIFFFLQCFPTKALYAFQSPRMRSTCPILLSLLDLVIVIMFDDEEYRL